VKLAPAQLAVSADEAVAIADRTGYPVVLKVESVDIPHKTEAKGVRLGLADAGAVRAAFNGILESARQYRPEARIAGVVVQPMAKGDVELVIGLQNDPAFGVVVMAGLGGIHIEVLKDVAFRKAPVSNTEAMGMLDELRARALLDGVRGRPPVDRDAVAAMIAAVSRFGAAAGPRLAELDLNPIMAGQGGALAVDWLLVTR
jgi:acetyltransferase